MRRLSVFVSAGVALALLAGTAFGQRPLTLAMSCGEAQSLVASHGAIVMSTGRHTYERFVATRGFCLLGEHAWPAYAPTADARQCPLGYTCRAGRAPWQEDFFD